MGKAQRTKGHNFERTIANDFREIGIDARRGRQDFSGAIEPDVVLSGRETLLPMKLWIECKCGKNPPLWPALDQAIKAAGAEYSPLVIAHRDRGPTIAIIEWSELLAMFLGATIAGEKQ